MSLFGLQLQVIAHHSREVPEQKLEPADQTASCLLAAAALISLSPVLYSSGPPIQGRVLPTRGWIRPIDNQDMFTGQSDPCNLSFGVSSQGIIGCGMMTFKTNYHT